MVIALLCASLFVPPADSAVLLIRVLDVSDARIGGDAILITDSAGGRARHILIDASDLGRTIVTKLRHFHVDTLAALILSHPHANPYGGMDEVLDAFPVRAFIYGGTPHGASTYLALLRRVAALRIPTVTADTGVRHVQLLTETDTVTLAVLAPPPDCANIAGSATGHDINDCSIGVRLSRGTFTALFPGDAEDAEFAWWMMTQPALLEADVLKASDHGSSSGTSATVLDVVKPEAVLISANGRQQPLKHVLNLLTARGLPTYCTADNGTITVRVPRDGGWKVTAERSGKCHPHRELTTGSLP